MRTFIAALLALVVVCAGTALAADQPKVTIAAQSLPIKDLVAQVSQQTGASIVLDPKAQGSVTLNLTGTDLSQALDIVTKLNGLTWKKLQFAKPAEENVKLDQIKQAMLTLASLQMVGLSVEDPASKTTSVFAKNLPTTPDTSSIKLPEGYEWTNVYVILSPEAPAPAKTAAAPGDAPDVSQVTENTKQNVIDLARLTPEQRQQVYKDEISAQLALAPEVRRQMMQDRRQAFRDLPDDVRQQLFSGGPGGRGGLGRRGRNGSNNGN